MTVTVGDRALLHYGPEDGEAEVTVAVAPSAFTATGLVLVHMSMTAPDPSDPKLPESEGRAPAARSLTA